MPAPEALSAASAAPPSGSAGGVVILGGGISGIAAALELAEAGRPVTLVEARGFLGGRAFSFFDQGSGRELDNGQHVIVGCCTRFRGFLERLGVLDKWFLQDRLQIPVLDRQGRRGTLAASNLPAPLHLLPSFLAYPHLGLTDKLRTLAGMARARFADRAHPHLEDITFYQWLREAGQSERAINNIWNLVVEPTLNDNVRDVSAAMGLMIVQDGMLAGIHNADLGYAREELSGSLGRPARRVLESKGVRILLNSPARRVLLEPQSGLGEGPASVAGVELASGETVRGGSFVSALPFSVLSGLLPRDCLAHPYFQAIAGLEWSPIVNAHILYDRPVMAEPFCAFVDSPLQWVFNRSLIEDRPDDSGQQLLTVSVSAAWGYSQLPREELEQVFLREMAEVFPGAAGAQVVSITVVKQREATFRCLPGAGRRRPDSGTPVSNLYLAGEWTNTGWPSTMEGAVRSGYRAARAALEGNGG